MDPDRSPRDIVAAAAEDARLARAEFDDARRWFARAGEQHREPLGAEVWVFDPAFGHVLLIEHRWRGWVPPGGAVERGETPRAAAARELAEETGVALPLLPQPAAVAVRSYGPGWAPTLGLSYAAVCDLSVPLRPEPGQHAAWTPLAEPWRSSFADDRARMCAYAEAARDQR